MYSIPRDLNSLAFTVHNAIYPAKRQTVKISSAVVDLYKANFLGGGRPQRHFFFGVILTPVIHTSLS